MKYERIREALEARRKRYNDERLSPERGFKMPGSLNRHKTGGPVSNKKRY